MSSMVDLSRPGDMLGSAADAAQVRAMLGFAVKCLLTNDQYRFIMFLTHEEDSEDYAGFSTLPGHVTPTKRLPEGVAARLGDFQSTLVCPLVIDADGRASVLGALFLAADDRSLNVAKDPLRALARQASEVLDRIFRAATVPSAQDSDHYFRALVRNTTDVVLIVDPSDFRIRYASPSATQVFDRRSIVGCELPDLVGPASGPTAREQLMTVVLESKTHDPLLRPAPGGEEELGQAVTADWTIVRDDRRLRFEVTCRDLRRDRTVDGFMVTMRDVTVQRQMEGQLTYQAFHDALTGLPNRMLFQERLARAVDRAGLSGTAVGVLVVDLDDFKIVNDTLGHHAGDELLRLVARRLTKQLREDDTAARLGGDEFAVLIENVDDPEVIDEVAGRIVDTLAQPFSVQGETVSGRASIGVSTTSDSADVLQLLRQADLALYVAKGDGKGNWRRHDPDAWSAIIERLELRGSMDAAVADGEFRLEYQPIVALADGSTVAMEALVRWDHPTRGLLMPDRFIDAAEESDTILALGGWIVDEAITTAARWLDRVGPGAAPYVSVNVSARQFRAPGFADTVQRGLDKAGLPPTNLVLELTESLLLHDGEQVWRDLADLRGQGVRVAVDDFGTGYSALSYLRHMPLDILKLDRTFIANLGSSPRDAGLIDGIIKLARTLNLDVVAEGVENERQHRLLNELGCAYGQGYLFSRPVPADVALKRIMHERSSSKQAPRP